MESDIENNAEEKQSEVKEKYVFPSIDLLSEIKNSSKIDNIKENKNIIQNTLHSFGINVKVVNSNIGPIATIYEIELLGNKVKISDVKKLKADLGIALGRIVINIDRIPGKALIGIEVENLKREEVSFKRIIDSEEYKNSGKYSIVLGKDYYGNLRLADISKMSHILVAGTTGSGKSMFIHSIILSLLYKCDPDLIKFLLIDTKAVELMNYGLLPHSLIPTITDPKRALGALEWAIIEMENRYNRFNQFNVKNINDYNDKVKVQENTDHKKMPQLVIVIDELADLLMTSTYEVENAIVVLSQKARAAGIHLVLVTQRPSANIVTGTIKANLNNRVSFKTASSVDSVTVLGRAGAEDLLRYGDYIYKSEEEIKFDRIECPFIPEEDVKKIIDFIVNNNNYEKKVIDIGEEHSISSKYQNEENDEPDPLLDDAIELVINAGTASTSFIQRHLKVNYARAGRIIDQMEERGLVSGYAGSKPRDVFISKERWEQLKNSKEINGESIVQTKIIEKDIGSNNSENTNLKMNQRKKDTISSLVALGVFLGVIILVFVFHYIYSYEEENRIDYNGLIGMTFNQIKEDSYSERNR